MNLRALSGRRIQSDRHDHVPEFSSSLTTESRLHGSCRNPWDITRSVGGSSGGSAAAVTYGAVPVAYGNDSAGSIRIPASCCGVFGFRPCRGRVPTGPLFGEIWHGLFSHHVLTRSVRDSAAVLDVSHGIDAGAPYGAPAPQRPYLDECGVEPGRLRIAVMDGSANGIELHGGAARVPLCWSAAGLPIGMMFTSRYADEATLFRLAAQLERMQPWRSRHPPLSAWGLQE